MGAEGASATAARTGFMVNMEDYPEQHSSLRLGVQVVGGGVAVGSGTGV